MGFLVGVFIVLFLTNRSRFFNIYWLGFILIGVVMEFLGRTFFSERLSEEFAYISTSVFIFGFIPAILLLLSVATFFNSKILMEKEGRRVRNLFISLIGIGALAILIVSVYIFATSAGEESLRHFVFYYAVAAFTYFLWLFTSCALYAWIYVAAPPTYKPQYIIVLGSGLIGDRVPPLLASRLDKAVKKFKKYGESSLLITSGGQGSDELVSEAAAMKKYIIDKHGIAPDKIIAEDQSTTTYENMLFSKRIIDERVPNAKGIFVTNNFHVYRASIYAHKVGLKAVGVGSKTALYYLPNAFMREFIGLLEMTKKWHITLFVLFTLVWFLLVRVYI